MKCTIFFFLTDMMVTAEVKQVNHNPVPSMYL